MIVFLRCWVTRTRMCVLEPGELDDLLVDVMEPGYLFFRRSELMGFNVEKTNMRLKMKHDTIQQIRCKF